MYYNLRVTLEKLLIIILIPIILILCLFISIMIRIGDKGSIFFIQDRIGYKGNKFRMIKFRTMYEGTDQRSLAIEGDERITFVGKWLRTTKLDELPQLIHVLRGEMSLIGPRPVVAYWNEIYQKQIPNYLDRYNILPGLTGLAQVKLGYTNTIAGEKEKYNVDLQYINNLNWKTDLYILLKTYLIIIINILRCIKSNNLLYQNGER